MLFGDMVRVARKKSQKSQKELAQQCGLAQQTICKIENSTYIPNVLIAGKIANACNVTVDFLLSENKN